MISSLKNSFLPHFENKHYCTFYSYRMRITCILATLACSYFIVISQVKNESKPVYGGTLLQQSYYTFSFI